VPFTVPNAVDAATYPQQARLDSRDLDVIVAASTRYGVLTGCAVTAQGTPNMTVAVGKGTVLVAARFVPVAAANSGTFAAASSSNPRIDLVTVDTTGTVQIVTGTAGPVPTIPTIPAGQVVLARVDVFTSATTITSAQIIDKRVMLNDGTALVYPEDYGALGNGRRINDATITSGSSTVTSATAVFTSGDTGRSFVMMRAGASAAPLFGTFTYVSATTGTLSVAAGATVAAPGEEFWLGTDDTQALQQALNACGAGQSMYVDPAKVYIRSSRFVTVTTTNGSTGITGTFVASDVGKSVVLKYTGIRWSSYIVSQTGTAAVLAAPAPTSITVAASVGLLTVFNSGTGIQGQATLVSLDQAQCALFVSGGRDITISDITLRNPNSARFTTGEAAGMFVEGTTNLVMRGVTIEGAGGGGLGLDRVTGFLVDEQTCIGTQADGFHITNGCTAGIVRRPTCRYTGDDGIAVVSYQSDPGGVCSDIKIYSPRFLGETGGRGVSVVGGYDVQIYDVYAERSSSAGLYIASEVAYLTHSVKNIRIVGVRLLNCNTNATVDHGSVNINNSQGADGHYLENINIEGVQIQDSRRTAVSNVRLFVAGGESGVMRKITLSQFDIEGGSPNSITYGNFPDSATSVNQLSWLVDGKSIADQIGFGAPSNQLYSDSTTGYWRQFAAIRAALNDGQEPVVTGEFLTPKHTTRSTLAMAAANNWVWFSRVEVTKKGGQAFNAAGVNCTVAQVAGTTHPRIGLYADDGSGSRPTGAVVYDWGDVAVLTGTVNVDKTATITATTVPPGIWWLAFGYQEAGAPTTRATLVTWTGGLQMANTTLGSAVPGHAWHQTGYAGAALPTVGTLVRDTNPPLVGLKAQ
jgi:hypothetical protein